MRRATDQLLWSGFVAAVLYGAAVAVGGLVLPAYDPLADPISAMTAVGRTDADWVRWAFGLYNGLVALFAGIVVLRKDSAAGWRVVGALLLATAIAGLLMGPFAMDAEGTAMTAVGMVHIGLAAFTSLATIATVALSIALWRARHAGRLAALAIGCLLLIVPFGLLAALATANSWPLAGLCERLTIGGFELWLASCSLALARTPALLASKMPSAGAQAVDLI